MNVLITGAGGQVGRALAALAPAEATVRGVTHAELDIADAAAVDAVLRDFRPAVLINAAGFTRVDDAEREQAAAVRANATGPAVLAAGCQRAGAWLAHVSTDYVFDGAHNRPYDTATRPNPLSVYGKTKLDGELAVTRELPSRSLIVRTSWVYGAEGRNFLNTMLPLMKTRPQLRVVSDQFGAPSSVTGLAGTLWALSLRRASGMYHWCDSGVASWYDFAVAIAEEAHALGLLTSTPEVVPIGTADYPTAAQRPAWSLLDKRATEQLLGVRAPHWRAALRETLDTIAARQESGGAP